MERERITMNVPLEDLLRKTEASELELYVNHSNIALTNNELLLDFYQIVPAAGVPNEPSAKHKVRLILPVNIVHGLAKALQTVSSDISNDITTQSKPSEDAE